MSLSGLLLPAPERAFPTGWHDRLTKAAIHADEAAAFAHADAWLTANDIDIAPPRDHRLLVEIAVRFGPRLAGHGAYPRLVGLRRMLWTRSRMALREAEPALRGLAGAGVEMLLFGGAARLADVGEGGGQVAHDLDIAIRPQQMTAAFDILIAQGWRPAQAASHHHVREHLASMRGVRMFKSHIGDIHLHAALFPPGEGEAGDDAALWERSRPASLDGVGVRLASPEDGLALSIAHGGLDAHDQGDWLIDVADGLSRTLDWPAFEAIVAARSLRPRALFALSYLSAEAGLPVPPDVLAGIAAAARARPLLYLAGFARSRPDYRSTVADKAIAGAARMLRKHAARRQARRAPDRWLAARRVATGDQGGPPVIEQTVAVPPALGHGARVHAILRIEAPVVRRRIEFEINAANRHIVRVRYRTGEMGGRPLILAIDGPIDIEPGETRLTLVSRPARLLRHGGGARQKARYDALPFRCIALEINGKPAEDG